MSSSVTPTDGPAAAKEPAAQTADLIAVAVRAVRGVADLHSGSFGEVATYLPGRRVPGVRIRDEETEVHVVLRWGAPVLETADAVRAAARTYVRTPVLVVVQDVVDPSARAAEQAPAASVGPSAQI